VSSAFGDRSTFLLSEMAGDGRDPAWSPPQLGRILHQLRQSRYRRPQMCLAILLLGWAWPKLRASWAWFGGHPTPGTNLNGSVATNPVQTTRPVLCWPAGRPTGDRSDGASGQMHEYDSRS